MGKMKRHPLYQMADALKRAFGQNGFTLLDDGERKELEETAVSMELFRAPSEITPEQILTLDGSYALRTRLLPAQLTSINRTLPIKAITAGRVYDARDDQYPARLFLEGIIAQKGTTHKDLVTMWDQIGLEIYGITAKTSLEPMEKGTFRIIVTTPPKNSDEEAEVPHTLGYIGPATWIARALIGQEDPDISCWVFTIDIDALTIQDYGFSDRKELFNCTIPFLDQFDGDAPCRGSDFSCKAANILRKMGYYEFVGDKVYTADAYIRMNMIQEAWDSNNQGVTLVKPLQNYHNPLTPIENRDNLPTVLPPALEQAMSENYAAGVRDCKLFEIGHIFKPGKNGEAPWEVLSISFGAYRNDLTLREFLADVTSFLRQLGINNHFFIPTDMAIAYRPDQCRVILDEKMQYLDGNCGHISAKALENFKIDSEAFMAQFELPTLEKKAIEEYRFVPNELK